MKNTDPFKLPRFGHIAHACRYVLQDIPAYRITPGPVRMAIKLRVYVCKCGRVHAVDTDKVFK